MKTNRRDFIKAASLAATGIATGGMTSCTENKIQSPSVWEISKREYKQKFNMSGFAAPPLDVVRIGYIGVGGRGLSSVRRMRLIEGVEIRALCDIYEERVNLGQKHWQKWANPRQKLMRAVKKSGGRCVKILNSI